MTDQEKLNETLVRQREIKDSIRPHISEIKRLADAFLAALEKNEFKEPDLDDAFDLNDAVQEQTQDINALLFDLRDTIGQ